MSPIPAGNINIRNIPPLPVTIALTYYPGEIGNLLEDGGSATDLRARGGDTIDFIYIAPPHVEIDSFARDPNCGQAFIRQSTQKNGFREYSTDIRVYELYGGNRCYLDSFGLEIVNNIAGTAPDTVVVMDTTTYQLKYYAGMPNFAGNRLKLLNVTARNTTGSVDAVESVVVLGERSRENTFTTTSPTVPFIILRDPPGDGSSASIEESSTFCKTFSGAVISNNQQTFTKELDIGARLVVYHWLALRWVPSTPWSPSRKPSSWLIYGKNIEIGGGYEMCATTTRAFSTSSGEDIVGGKRRFVCRRGDQSGDERHRRAGL